MRNQRKLLISVFTLLLLTGLPAFSQTPGPEDALEVVGRFSDMYGEAQLRERARQVAQEHAARILKGKPEGSGVIVHVDYYDVPSHPDSVFKPKDVVVHVGGAGTGKTSAIREDLKPRIYPGRTGEKVQMESVYFEKKPAGILKKDIVTRADVDAVRSPKREADTKGPPKEKGSKEKEAKEKGSKEKEAKEKEAKEKGAKEKGAKEKGAKEKGSLKPPRCNPKFAQCAEP